MLVANYAWLKITFYILVLYGSYAHFMKAWYPYRNMENVLNIQFEEMKHVSLTIGFYFFVYELDWCDANMI